MFDYMLLCALRNRRITHGQEWKFGLKRGFGIEQRKDSSKNQAKILFTDTLWGQHQHQH